ncbi:MAG: oxidoreductase [Rhodospirillaceae bacterium TMED167]|nr:oxidoreductase [Rhodospirillaceae bacterium]OUW23142.1 MAG: oxidoreductase [Rhodospirillaceae bacterium TMED167]
MDKGLKTAVITGASQGIGEAAALLFIERGWQVITCARSAAPSFSTSDRWLAHIETDLSVGNGVTEFIEQTLDVIGNNSLDTLVNNAGVSPKSPNRERQGCLNGDIDTWRDVFELNFYAPLKLGRGFAASLAKGKGSIVNVTSIAGHKIHPFAGSAYSASKAALSALTREMANEFAALNVRVNAVAPGEISTEMIEPEYEMLIPRIPLNRIGTPDDTARAIHYLASEEAAYITGTEIWVTGGQHIF